MRLPFPAARTTTASLRADMVEPEQCKDGRSESRGAAEGSSGGGRRRKSRKLWNGPNFPLKSTFVAAYYNAPAHRQQAGKAEAGNNKRRAPQGNRRRQARTERRRVGKGGLRTCSSRQTPN